MRFEDGSIMRLYRQTVEDFALFDGMELDADTVTKLKIAAEEMSAKMRAVRIVSVTNVSKKDLQKRLVAKGENPQNAKNAVAWMEELNLIDDKKTAELIVQRCATKGYGISRAKQALYEKRIPKEYWDKVLADYPDQTDTIVRFLRERMRDLNNPKSKKRVIDALLRRGHSYSDVRRAFSIFALDADSFGEDFYG